MKKKLEPQNRFHRTYLLINSLKDKVETGTMEYISPYLFTHKFTARKQLFIISYQWVVLKIRLHYLVEFTSLRSKSIVRTDIFFYGVYSSFSLSDKNWQTKKPSPIKPLKMNSQFPGSRYKEHFRGYILNWWGEANKEPEWNATPSSDLPRQLRPWPAACCSNSTRDVGSWKG